MMQQRLNGNQFHHKLNQQKQFNKNIQHQSSGQKIRLRRNVKQAVIEQNLNHLEQKSHKKRLAQALYYNSKIGQSPLTRNNQNVIQTDVKLPVHNRLGNKIRLRKNINHLPNQNMTLKKIQPGLKQIRLQKIRPHQGQVILKMGVASKRSEKVKRIYTAQSRLAKIRQINNNFVPRGILPQGNMGQKIRLRRNRIHGTSPMNYTVQVKNNSLRNHIINKHNINAELDPKLQEEIRMIQCKNNNPDVIAPLPIHPQGTGVTCTTLNERFSQLPI